MSAYPYDWKGSATTNQFTEERILESDIPSERVLVLQHRPFFANGLTVRQPTATNPLTLGVDYELAYQLTELDDAVDGKLFCAVNVINPLISGPLVITGQHLGGTYYDGLLEILDDLVKHLNNPTSMSFYNVENRPSLYPQTPAATSWADLLNKKYVASAVHDVDLDAGSANDAIKAKLAQLKATMDALAAEVEAFNYPAHINAKNPHGTTAAQIAAHPISLKAADTFLAYGKTFRQLTAEIRALGLQQTDIDKYIATYPSKDIQGTFVQLVQANRPLFKSRSGASSILFTDTGFDLKTSGGIALRAGYKGDTAYFEWQAGSNVMRIESSGNALGMDKLSVNGRQLLTTTTLMDYQGTGDDGGGSDPDDSKLYVQSQSVELTTAGKGSKADPVTWNLTLPNATASTDGAVTLTDTASDVASGQAVRPQAVAANDAKLATFLPKATRLNSQPMDGTGRTLGKADIGLSDADNTADVDKAISTYLQTGLDGKSAKSHKHAWADLGILQATTDDYGTIRIAVNEAGLAAGRGTAPNVLYQLQLQLAVIADKLQGANPKAVADYAVIGASTWSVASSKLAMSVVDLKYFYMADGGRKEGKASGSVNLETTPMFNWFSPYNTIERNWATGLKHNTQLPLSSIVTTLPLYATTIGLTASQMGDLSVISVLAKERVACSTGRLRVIAAGGGNLSVYIDGALVASGAATVDADFDVDPSLSSHCVAIRADCNDSTKPAAMVFEIWDGRFPIRASSTETKLVQLAEFIAPQNNRHFLYLNMSTGSMFGRAEPIASDDINVTQTLIGYVDCGATGLTATTVAFETVADFGVFEELSNHQNTVPAHVPASTDWYLSDNTKMKRMATVSDKPDYIAAGPNGGVITQSQAVLSVVAPANAAGQLSLWLDTKYSGPQQWMTPSNPYENGLLTYEGSLALWLPAKAVVGTDLWLTFAQKARNGKHKYFHVNPFTDAAEYGYLNSMAINGAAMVTRTPGDSAPLAVYPYNISTATATDPNTWGAVDTSVSETRYILRYRFVPKTNTLRLQFVYFESDSGTPTVRNVTYEMPFDVRDCMGGFVGFNRKQQLAANTHALHAGIYLSSGYHDYNYFRSLFEAYVRGADMAVQGTGRGIQQKVRSSGIQNNWSALNQTTEFIGISTTGGKPLASVNKYVPLLLHFDRPLQNQPTGPEITKNKLWSDTANPLRGTQFSTPFALVTTAPWDYDSVKWDVISNYAVQGTVGKLGIVSLSPQGGNTQSGTGTTAGVGYKGDQVIANINPIQVAAPFFLECTLTFSKNGATVGTLTFADAGLVVSMQDTGSVLYLCKFHPFNMTTTMWDWVTNIMTTEEGASTTLGVWN